MKKNRQEAILQIVRENAVATQDELIAQLNKAGFCDRPGGNHFGFDG